MKTTEVAMRTGASLRRLNHWDSLGIIKPAKRAAMGSGSHREYSNAQVEVIAVMVDLIDTTHMPPRLAAVVAAELAVTGRTQLTGALVAVEVLRK